MSEDWLDAGARIDTLIDASASAGPIARERIDVCYELAGRLRRVWRGFDGGREAREEMATFFTRVRQRSAP